MNLEEELRSLLLGENLPSRTKKENTKKALAEEMVKRILPFLSAIPFGPVRNDSHLHEMIELYEKWRAVSNSNEESDRYFKEKIITYLLKICHFWWVDNLTIAEKIITVYYSCCPELIGIVYGEIDPSPTWNTFFEYKNWLLPNVGGQYNNDISPLNYSLSHYDFDYIMMCDRNIFNMPQLHFGTRVNSLVEDCFYRAKPDKLLLLLQYGVSVSGLNEEFVDADVCLVLLEEMVAVLAMYIEDQTLNRTPRFIYPPTMDREVVVLDDEYFNNKIECGKILLRVAPCVQTYHTPNERVENLINRAKTLSIVERIPFIVNISRPFRLKALCRHFLRCTLRYSTGLPRGILLLEIPDYLKDFLNLLID